MSKGNSEAINELIANLTKIGQIDPKEISDRYHTIGELYHHRIILFAVICMSHADLAWKSKLHYDEENDPMFDDSFVAGIRTPMGDATYHIKLKYWELFDIEELERAPKWDGHNSNDAATRVLSLVYGRTSKIRKREPKK